MNLRYIDLDENLLTRGSDGTYYRLRIGQDDWIDSPRDWSPLGHMLCWNRRYNLGDKHDYSEPIDFWHDMVAGKRRRQFRVQRSVSESR